MEPTFFASPDELRVWLERHHDRVSELLVGFHKKGSDKPSITWPESVDQALCFGWIDGVRRRIDDASYSIRFTPRTQRSIWSAVNVKRMKELIDASASAFFESQAPSYRRAAIHWVTSAKRPETRERRLTQLIECSAAGKHVPPLARR